MLPEYEIPLSMAMMLLCVCFIMKFIEIQRDDIGNIHKSIIYTIAYLLLTTSLFLPLPVMMWFALMAVVTSRANKIASLVFLLFKLILIMV